MDYLGVELKRQMLKNNSQLATVDDYVARTKENYQTLKKLTKTALKVFEM